MRDLTAVCAAARHISLTGGWNGRTVGTKGAQKEGERRTRARSRTWPAVKGCGNKSAAHCGLTDTLEAISTSSLWSQEGSSALWGNRPPGAALGTQGCTELRCRGLVRRMSGKP